MTSPALALALAGLLLAAGCASTGPAASRRGESAPRVRCLADPHETGTRPLFFLFCLESP